MMSIQDHMQNVVNRKSRDCEWGEAIQYFLGILDHLGIEYIAMGSCALQTYLDFFHRLPGDFDITLPEHQIDRIRDFCEMNPQLRFEFHEVACKLYYSDSYYLHLIPDKMKIIDKITKDIFMRIDVFHIDRTEFRRIGLVNYDHEIIARVPILEYAFCLNIFIPLDSNNFADNVAILEKYVLKKELIVEFLHRVPSMRELVRIRLLELTEKLSELRPDLVLKVPVT